VKSIHSFLLDVERELKRIRIVSLIGLAACLLILVSLARFAVRLMELAEFSRAARVGIAIDAALVTVAAASLAYSVYALYSQDRFFRRWGHRFELLEGAERRLLGEKGNGA